MLKIFLYVGLTYLFILEPYLEYRLYSDYTNNDQVDAKVAMYRSAWLRNICVASCILFGAYYYSVPLSSLGFRALSWPHSWISEVGFALMFIVYFFMFYWFTVIYYRFSPIVKSKVVSRLVPFSMVLPMTVFEKRWWAINAFSSSFEELIYRGFVFFAFIQCFPTLSIYLIAVLSVLLDGLRYIHRPAAMWYVLMSSIIFVTSFLLFQSIWPAIFLHTIHDLRVLFMPLNSIQKLMLTQQNKGAIS